MCSGSAGKNPYFIATLPSMKRVSSSIDMTNRTVVPCLIRWRLYRIWRVSTISAENSDLCGLRTSSVIGPQSLMVTTIKPWKRTACYLKLKSVILKNSGFNKMLEWQNVSFRWQKDHPGRRCPRGESYPKNIKSYESDHEGSPTNTKTLPKCKVDMHFLAFSLARLGKVGRRGGKNNDCTVCVEP